MKIFIQNNAAAAQVSGGSETKCTTRYQKTKKKKKTQKAKLLTPAERLVLHDCELSRENIIYLNILNLPLSNVYVHSVVQVYCLRAH